MLEPGRMLLLYAPQQKPTRMWDQSFRPALFVWACISQTQAGSGKTRLVRSLQLQQIWRGATAENMEGLGGAQSEEAGGGNFRTEAPAIISVCRNVHANTPYYVWKTILNKIFNLRNEVCRSRMESLQTVAICFVCVCVRGVPRCADTRPEKSGANA